MIELGDKSDCICKKYNSKPKGCINEYEISEKGKSIKLVPRNSSEKVTTIIIDKCIITDEKTKCDALFLYNNSKKISFLVELKGAGEIHKAFSQLSYTRDKRKEYQDIITKFKKMDTKKLYERFIIVSNGILSKTKKEKLEKEHRIRVYAILSSEATKPIPNLRDYI